MLVDAFGGGSPVLRLTLGTCLFLTAGLGAQYLGRLVGKIYQKALLREDMLRADHLAGAVAAPVLVLVVVWILVVPAMEGVPGRGGFDCFHASPAGIIRASSCQEVGGP